MMLTKQQAQQTINIGRVALIKTGYANYCRNSTTNGSNALIDVLENVLINVPSIQEQSVPYKIG